MCILNCKKASLKSRKDRLLAESCCELSLHVDHGLALSSTSHVFVLCHIWAPTAADFTTPLLDPGQQTPLYESLVLFSGEWMHPCLGPPDNGSSLHTNSFSIRLRAQTPQCRLRDVERACIP